jgi:melanoma-associated antigen p97
LRGGRRPDLIKPPRTLPLQGKNSCHTGYRKSAGWTIPVGYLVEEGVMPVISANPTIQNDAESVSSFFGKVRLSCATGPAAAGARHWQ